MVCGLVGIVPGVLIGLAFFTSTDDVWTRLLFGGAVGLLFGATFGALIGGGMAIESTDRKLAGRSRRHGPCRSRPRGHGVADGTVPTDPNRSIRRRTTRRNDHDTWARGHPRHVGPLPPKRQGAAPPRLTTRLRGRRMIHAGQLREDLRIGNRAFGPIVQDKGSSSCAAWTGDGHDGEHVGGVRRTLQSSDRFRIDTARGRVFSARKTMNDTRFAWPRTGRRSRLVRNHRARSARFAPRPGRSRRVPRQAPGTPALPCSNPTTTFRLALHHSHPFGGASEIAPTRSPILASGMARAMSA